MDKTQEKYVKKVLIADDEYMIIKGLERMIDWKGLGLSLVGTARHGRDALNLMEQEVVDIIITDINMPGMDGLSFIQAAKEVYPHIEFIFISGYQRFDYVKQGLTLGATDYLLKPVNKEELESSLKKLINRIDERFNSTSASNFIMKQKMRNWLQDVTKGDEVPPLHLDYYHYYLITQDTSMSFDSLVDYYEGQADWIVVGKDEMLAMVMPLGNLEMEYGKIVGRVEKLKDIRVHAAYQQIRKRFRHLNFYVGAGSLQDKAKFLLSLPMINTKHDRQEQEISEVMGQIFHVLESNQVRRLSALLNQLRDQLSYYAVSRSEAIQIFQSFVHFHQGNEIKLDQVDTVDDLVSQTTEILRIQDDQAAFDQLHPTLQDLLKRVEENYRSDISLSSLAENLHMNVMYLGQLFKKEIGVSFSKYLNRYRVEKSKPFLVKTTMPISDVAIEVGYQNQTYYYRIFKELVGVSPKEYRQLHKQEQAKVKSQSN